MKKAILLLVGCCLSFHTLQSQIVYAYDWHQPFDGKAMLKIKTWEDGLYNIRQSAVSHLSPALANAPADSLRLYFRGEQVRIKVFPNGARGWSKVEFLGQYLDGAEETQLYRNNKTGVPEPISQTNSRVSLFTDTCAYYLVASGHDVPLRWKDEGDFNFQNSQPLASFPFRSSLNFFPEDLNNTLNILSGGAAYGPYNSLNCDYVLGEGYVSRASFGQGDSRTFRVQTPNAVPGTQQVSMQSRVFHRSKTQARLRITYNGQSAALLDTFWPSSNIYIHTYQRSFSAVVNNESEFRFEALANGPADNNHIAWLDMNYERLPRFDHDSSMYFPAIPAGSYLRLEDVGGRDSIWFFSKKSGQRFRGVMQNDTAHVLLAALNTTSSLLAYTDESIREPILDSARPKALCDPQSGADMLIITHPQLDSSAHAYAAFRDSAGLSTRIVFIDDIYDAFGYGSATPLAIHRFINCALERWNQKPQYVLLWGDSDYRFRRNGPNNLIPTYGFPSSDIYFTSPLNPLDSDDILPQIPIGRVCIQTNKDGFTYLKHARCWRSDVNEKWMSKGSFFAGDGLIQSVNIEAYVKEYQREYHDGAIRGDSSCVYARRNLGTSPECLISSEEGLHVAVGSRSSQIGIIFQFHPYERDSAFKPSFFVDIGGGNDFTQESSFAERIMTQQQNAAVAYLGATITTYQEPALRYGNIFFDRFAGTMVEHPIGDVMLATAQAMNDTPGVHARNIVRQMNLLGDPSLVLSRRNGFPLGISLPQSDVRIYPNPTSEYILIQGVEVNPLSIRLLNVEGRTISCIPEYQNGTIKLDVSEIAKGLYFLHFQQKGIWQSTKVIVK